MNATSKVTGTPKVSVIVPVYNAERYIGRCAGSLFGQTMEELEFVFVDDCSPDDSIRVLETVLERYPHRRPQVRIIRHETNQGVGRSRQAGLDAATGDYPFLFRNEVYPNQS